MSDIEFVSIDENGIERDWIDPVVSVNEFDTHYMIDNGFNDYEVKKQSGWTYIQRTRGEEQ